ncbi:MAG: TetR/AcrR family transcriptional regulator [Acidimicrobiales bacterium]
MSTTGAVTLRSDAARNREALVAAARATFGQRGLDAPLDDIARTAGTGNATLYRHFPTRCDLVAAVFADTLREVVDACARAMANPDPWEAFRGHVTFLCELQANDRGLADLLTARVTGAPALERLRERAHQGLRLIAERAKASGALRPDFEPEDLALLLMANAGLIHRTAARAPIAWRRHLGYVLDGLHRGAARTEAPPSPGLRAVRLAMVDQAAQFGCR